MIRTIRNAHKATVKCDVMNKCVRGTYVGGTQLHVVCDTEDAGVVPWLIRSQAGSQVARVEQLLE